MCYKSNMSEASTLQADILSDLQLPNAFLQCGRDYISLVDIDTSFYAHHEMFPRTGDYLFFHHADCKYYGYTANPNRACYEQAQ